MTALSVAASAEPLPATDGRYLPIAFPGTLEPRFESEKVLALQAAVLNYLVARNGAHDQRRPNRAICVGVGPMLPIFDPPEALMPRLSPAAGPLRTASACAVDRQDPSGRPHLVLRGDGAQAIALWVDVAEPNDGVAEVRAGYYAGVLNGTLYRCHVRRETRRWSVDTCEVVAIS